MKAGFVVMPLCNEGARSVNTSDILKGKIESEHGGG